MESEQGREAPGGRVVVGTDGSAASAVAVRWALEAAGQTGAWLDVVLVWSPTIDFGWLGAPPVHGWHPEPAVEGHALVGAVIDRACPGPRPDTVRVFVIEGDPVQCLVTHAVGADVLVLADRGAGGFLGLHVGSVASACTARASCPVLIVPAGRAGWGAVPDARPPDPVRNAWTPTFAPPPVRSTAGVPQ